MEKQENICMLRVCNDGIPFPETLNFEKADSFGITLIKELTEQISGTIKIINSESVGYSIRFPYDLS